MTLITLMIKSFDVKVIQRERQLLKKEKQLLHNLWGDGYEKFCEPCQYYGNGRRKMEKSRGKVKI